MDAVPWSTKCQRVLQSAAGVTPAQLPLLFQVADQQHGHGQVVSQASSVSAHVPCSRNSRKSTSFGVLEQETWPDGSMYVGEQLPQWLGSGDVASQPPLEVPGREEDGQGLFFMARRALRTDFALRCERGFVTLIRVNICRSPQDSNVLAEVKVLGHL